MPEGPEIRRLADRLDRLLGGRVIERAWFAFPHLQAQVSRLEGRRLISVTSRGKALLSRFDEGSVIYSHNQLYGVWRVGRRGEMPVTARSPRLRLSTARHDAWLFSASDISLWREAELAHHPFLSRLGPEPLDPGVDVADVVARLRLREFSSRQLGVLLLDQGFLAGIGNYLRSEALFFAGLLPEWRPRELDDAQCAMLAESILSVTRRAYRRAGVTNLAAWREPMIAQGLTRRHWRHAVFGRTGEPCHACGTPIGRRLVASRRLYCCPHCQR